MRHVRLVASSVRLVNEGGHTHRHKTVAEIGMEMEHENLWVIEDTVPYSVSPGVRRLCRGKKSLAQCRHSGRRRDGESSEMEPSETGLMYV